jgi:large subunit ribosomal protein L10
MRPEKKQLVTEVDRHLGKSDYVYLVNYTKLTVSETADLRGLLSAEGAEFHVIKNSILQVAARERGLPDLAQFLAGQVGIVVGGRNPAGVAKVLKEYHKSKDRVELRGGALGAHRLSADDVKALADLPPLPVLRGQLLGVLQAPAQKLVSLLQAPAQQLLNVLDAKAKADGGETA